MRYQESVFSPPHQHKPIHTSNNLHTTMLLLPFLIPAALASPLALVARENDGSSSSSSSSDQVPNVVRSTWDGQCFYPTADETFHLPSYLGKWFQIAGTLAPFTSGCSCITAEYSLNDNGTVNVQNSCQAGGQTVPIQGTAEVADAAYGSKGVLRVQFPGQPAPDCPGPNYIVQGESASLLYPNTSAGELSGMGARAGD